MWFVVKGGWPQMILLFLIMRCTPTIRELIEATPLSPSSPSATSLSALAPAQRAGAQRLCALARLRHADGRRACLFIGVDRKWPTDCQNATHLGHWVDNCVRLSAPCKARVSLRI